MANIRKRIKSNKHNPYQISFNQEFLFQFALQTNLLLLYLQLRRYARFNFGSFKGLLKKLSHHERYVLLPKLIELNLATKTNILNHRDNTIDKFGTNFVKIPNSINTKEKLKAFIVAAAETQILKVKYHSYKYEDNKHRDQANGYTVTRSLSSRHRQRYVSYSGKVIRQRVKDLTGYALDTISRLRNLSANKYSPLQLSYCWHEDNSSYHPYYNSFIHYFPKSINSKVHSFSLL